MTPEQTRCVVSSTQVEQTVPLKSPLEYDREMSATVSKLGELSNLSLPERRHVAFAIVGEEVADTVIRESLRARYCSDDVSLGSTAMKALDGGYHEMWAKARDRS